MPREPKPEVYKVLRSFGSPATIGTVHANIDQAHLDHGTAYRNIKIRSRNNRFQIIGTRKDTKKK